MNSEMTTVLLAFLVWQTAPEERVDDSEYEKNVAVHVRAVQSIEKNWRKEPAECIRIAFDVIWCWIRCIP